MSATRQAADLTLAYRNALRVQAATVAQVIAAAWRNVDADRIDASMSRVLPQIAATITGGQGRAADLSLRYLRSFVAAELHLADLAAVTHPVDVTALLGRTVTGKSMAYALGFQPIHAKRLISRGRSGHEAVALCLKDVQAVSSGELFRVAQAAMIAQAEAMPDVLGYRRITGGAACGFCHALASRGAVYRLETSGFRSHKKCVCSAEPVVRDVESTRFLFAA